MANEKYDSSEVYEHSIPVQEALERLESIENANPSKAIECLESFKNFFTDRARREPNNPFNDKWLEKIDTIKQALLKSQEQEKVLKIIFEKQVNFEVFGAFETYKDYEIYYNKRFHLIEHKLTEEEFDKLKRYLK